MAGSSDEREIRDTVATWLRGHYPDGRVIHELNCAHGRNRVDVASVTPRQIIAIEIKSKKDTLKRLAGQIATFRECSHAVVTVADEKFWEHFQYDHGDDGFRPSKELLAGTLHSVLWCYPPQAAGSFQLYSKWRLGEHCFRVPDTRELLRLLWTDELRTVAVRHALGLKGVGRIPGYQLVDTLWSCLTGSEIEKAVCAALRARVFAEADEPIALPELTLKRAS